MMNTPIPKKVVLHRQSAYLALDYGDVTYQLNAEFLRVHSPSAEVQGHGEGKILQTGKRDVAIQSVKMVGNYALRIVFDDGHGSGLYTWEYLYHLSTHQDTLWSTYLQQLETHHASRDPHVQVVQWKAT